MRRLQVESVFELREVECFVSNWRRNLCEVWAAQEAEPRRAAFLPHLPRTNAQVREAGAGYCKSKLTWHLHSRDREGERHEAKSKRREPRFATGERHLNHLDTETHMTT